MIEMASGAYDVLFGAWYYSPNAGTPALVYTSRTTTTLEIQGRWNGSSQSGVKGNWRIEGMSARGASQQTRYIIKY